MLPIFQFHDIHLSLIQDQISEEKTRKIPRTSEDHEFSNRHGFQSVSNHLRVKIIEELRTELQANILHIPGDQIREAGIF